MHQQQLLQLFQLLEPLWQLGQTHQQTQQGLKRQILFKIIFQITNIPADPPPAPGAAKKVDTPPAFSIVEANNGAQ